MDYRFLLDLAIILISTKMFGLVTKKFNMPQVVGALLAGVILGPACLGMISAGEGSVDGSFIEAMAELGVIVLMFAAGMETDINELKKCGKASFIIAILGVVVPLAGGTGIAYIFNRPEMIMSDASAPVFLQNIFIGVILTATSVSITVETLREMGKLKTEAGNAILGAAIIDDILGIIALTIVISMSGGKNTVGLPIVLGKIALFFIVCIFGGFIFYKVFQKWCDISGKPMHRHAIMAFAVCLIMSYIAEEVFGVADITGAFMAGLIISMTTNSTFVASKFDVLSYLFLSPIFFASIGLKVELPNMTGKIVVFGIMLIVVAIMTKIVGCGVGAKICGYTNAQCLRIGVGMISRGEVALIVANKGLSVGLIGTDFLGPIVLVVVFTTIITPIMLKPVFQKDVVEITEEQSMSGNYDELDELRKSL
ncbi:MAG: cation:proton antiporter [Lachnospiraceae bacterium]|nr:cation:proton antiporter [Lachnospiraceae bacterium]